VPDHSLLLTFPDPAYLVESLHDTLYSHWEKKTYQISIYDPLVYGPTFSPYRLDNAKVPLVTRVSAPLQQSLVYFKKLTDSTVYFRVREFGQYTREEMRQFDTVVRAIPNVILDLRGNPGGYVSTCTSMVEKFLPARTHYLTVNFRKVEIKAARDTGTVTGAGWTTLASGDAWEGKKIAVLMNEGSASATEILIVALKAGLKDRSRLFGVRSFGKGIGQVVFRKLNDVILKLTTMRFMPASGVDYHETGIAPDQQITGTLESQVSAAGRWCETDFESRINPDSLQAVIQADAVPPPGIAGEQFLEIKQESLPF
jgi:hypothetical protein